MNPSRRKTYRQTENNGIEECEEVLEEDIFEWLDVENQHPSFQILNDEEIIQAVNSSSDIIGADNEAQRFGDSRTISHTEGVQALTTALKYLEQTSDVTPIDLLLLKNWRDKKRSIFFILSDVKFASTARFYTQFLLTEISDIRGTSGPN